MWTPGQKCISGGNSRCKGLMWEPAWHFPGTLTSLCSWGRVGEENSSNYRSYWKGGMKGGRPRQYAGLLAIFKNFDFYPCEVMIYEKILRSGVQCSYLYFKKITLTVVETKW